MDQQEAIDAVLMDILDDPVLPAEDFFDDYESDDDDDDFDLIRLLKTEREHHIRNSFFVEHVVDHYSEKDFRSHFRISRAGVQKLLDTLGDTPVHVRGQPKVPKRHALLLSLWVLATQETFRSTGDRFGFDRGHAFRLCMEIWKELYDKSYIWINFPEGDAALRCVEAFQKYGFPGVVGIVDGCHIAIPGPLDDNSFSNRKKFHSILLQGVVDSHMRFIDIFCGFPGSAHDARVWKESPLGVALAAEWQTMLPEDTHIIGDKAYASLNYLVVPFKDDGGMTAQRKAFNKLLSRVRVKVEHSFGRLKGIFTRLKYLRVYNLKYAKYYITAACVLHNIVIEERFELGDLEFDMHEEEDVGNDDVELNGLFGDGNVESGLEKRIRLMNALIPV